MYLYHGTDTKFDYFELEALKKNRLDFTQLCATTEYAIALINNWLVGEGTPYVI